MTPYRIFNGSLRHSSVSFHCHPPTYLQLTMTMKKAAFEVSKTHILSFMPQSTDIHAAMMVFTVPSLPGKNKKTRPRASMKQIRYIISTVCLKISSFQTLRDNAETIDMAFGVLRRSLLFFMRYMLTTYRETTRVKRDKYLLFLFERYGAQLVVPDVRRVWFRAYLNMVPRMKLLDTNEQKQDFIKRQIYKMLEFADKFPDTIGKALRAVIPCLPQILQLNQLKRNKKELRRRNRFISCVTELVEIENTSSNSDRR